MQKRVKLGSEVGGFLKSLQLFMFVPANQAHLEDKALFLDFLENIIYFLD